MPSIESLHEVYFGTAYLHSKLSKANRLKVGACIVTASGAVIPGYNGTPAGTDNACEEYDFFSKATTKPEVLHAELNAILKCAREGISCFNATMYITHAPCRACSAMIVQSGIKKVFYREEYRDLSGTEYLNRYNVPTIKV